MFASPSAVLTRRDVRLLRLRTAAVERFEGLWRGPIADTQTANWPSTLVVSRHTGLCAPVTYRPAEQPLRPGGCLAIHAQKILLVLDRGHSEQSGGKSPGGR